MFPIF
jgi:hypothetical protein